jgi:hypothetical protein
MAEPQDDGDGVVEESEADILPEQSNSQSSKKSRGRRLAVAAVVALLLLAGLSIPAYRFVRDYYNPWITEANWKRIQPGMTLREVEAIVSKGKPCALEDVKVVVDKQNEVARNVKATIAREANRPTTMPPFVQQFFPPVPQNLPSDWDKSDDVVWQAKRQKVDSWYQWKKGDTRLFVGVNSENKVRLACLAKGENAGISWVYAVYPLADMEVIERTGKSVEAKLPQEKLVEAYIRAKAADPASVEIASWGPHDLKGELVTVPGFQLIGERRRKPVVKVRVRYWTKDPEGAPQLNDKLYYLQNGEVFGSFSTPHGNQWIEVLRGVERQLYRGR